MSDVRIIVPQALKADVRSILKEQDLTVSQAVRLFFKEIVNQGGLPFGIERRQPNAVTLAAMKASREDSTLTTYDTAEALFASWDADRD